MITFLFYNFRTLPNTLPSLRSVPNIFPFPKVANGADDACLLVFMPFYDPSFCKWARPCDLLLNNRMASVMGVASTIRLEKVTSVLLADFVSFWASRL